MARRLTEGTVATEKDVSAPWSGYRDGRNFRCGMCGEYINVGDRFRLAVLLPKAPNTIVCGDCDGPDFLDRWVRHVEDAKESTSRYWFLFPDESHSPNPAALRILRKQRQAQRGTP